MRDMKSALRSVKIARANSAHPRRAYEQAARAEQTATNAQNIVEAAISLVHSARRLADITLEDVARDSGLTVRTIFRRFGSRDGVLDAAFLKLKEKVKGDRPQTPRGDTDAALASLLQQYERDGDLMIKGLEQQGDLPQLHELIEYGRGQHREWLVEVFGPHLSYLSRAAREQRITELYAATDVYIWKLLRRDLHLGKQQTAKTIRSLVLGVLTHADVKSARRGG